ncbi:MAG: DUF2513 domain-containing protein [Rhodothermales bacterium]
MKRNLDLMRHILLQVEEQGDPAEPLIHALSLDDVDQHLVDEHVKLLIDSKMLEGEYKYTTNNRILFTAIRSLTSRGHDFLDNVRNPNVWNHIKERVQTTTGTASFDLIEDLSRQLVAAALSRPRTA